jgi:NAD(P)H dehydrogenase (quinone)
MYAITGITGKVGGTLARALLSAGYPVRAIVRDAAKGEAWKELGCEVALASMEDTAALAAAFTGATAVFILPPPDFDPPPGYAPAKAVIASVAAALKAAKPAKVLCLSTIGADATQDNLLSQRTLMEQALLPLGLPITFLRPGWFLDNAAWDVAPARDSGALRSFLMPLDKPFPMVSSLDVGRIAAKLIQQNWTGTRIVELEGPSRVSPNDIAAAFATVLGRPVRAEIVPRDTWESLFRSQGMQNPTPRIRMLDGFNEDWIAFKDQSRTIKGTIDAATVVAALVEGQQR